MNEASSLNDSSVSKNLSCRPPAAHSFSPTVRATLILLQTLHEIIPLLADATMIPPHAWRAQTQLADGATAREITLCEGVSRLINWEDLLDDLKSVAAESGLTTSSSAHFSAAKPRTCQMQINRCPARIPAVANIAVFPFVSGPTHGRHRKSAAHKVSNPSNALSNGSADDSLCKLVP